MTHLIAKGQILWSQRDRGATAVEYGLMLMLIAMAIVFAVSALGSNVSAMFDTAAGWFS